ncbi:MAG TPA: fused MFS/spermidine synthase [Caulobacterales bacterium]|nr:fused MFS/spermidine synthase [Caulobacterales bacterium]
MAGSKRLAVLAVGFVLGVALMGFEMVASRYLYPYYGSGIEVWAALISTVLLALMAGYFIGGQLADKYPRSEVLGGVVLVAAAMLGVTPPIATPLLDFMLDKAGDGVGSMLVSCVLLLFAPLTLLSFFSPFAVRLILKDSRHAGAVSGAIYSINTIGNVVGTLGVSLTLIPLMGSRAITYLFAGVIAACGAALILLKARGHDHE